MFFSSPQLRYETVQFYAKSNQRVARTYLLMSDGKLFTSPAPDPKQTFDPIKTKNIDLVSKLHAIFLTQIFKELSDKLLVITEGLNQQKREYVEALNQQKREYVEALNQQKREYVEALNQQKHEYVEALNQQKIDTTNKLKKCVRKQDKNNLKTENLIRNISISVWLNARGKKMRKIKNFLRPETTIIRNSGLFCNTWYLEQYPEVASSGVDPIQHYVDKGVTSGCNPSADFDTVAYMQQSVSVMNSGLNPLASYILKKNIK